MCTRHVSVAVTSYGISKTSPMRNWAKSVPFESNELLPRTPTNPSVLSIRSRSNSSDNSSSLCSPKMDVDVGRIVCENAAVCIRFNMFERLHRYLTARSDNDAIVKEIELWLQQLVE